MKMISKPSPNFNSRHGTAIDCVVLHATADTDTQESIAWCRMPAPQNPNPVSYHVIVDRDGTVYTLVDSEKRAWHAGVSVFQGRPDVNDFSVGLSFANKNDGVEPYPGVQLAVGASLVAGWMHRYPGITLDRVTTHRVIAPTRKTDPAPPAFDLAAFKDRVSGELIPQGGDLASGAA